MKLSQDQIAHLYEFTRQHYLEYYDLQTELVDHLANSIEEQWQENPKLSFEAALNVEFKKFGIFGFMDIVDKRKDELTNKYENIVKEEFKSYLTIPGNIGIVLLWMLLPTFMTTIQLINLASTVFLIEYLVRFIKWLIRMFDWFQSRNKRKWLFKVIMDKHIPSSTVFLLFIAIYQLLRFKGEWILRSIPEYILSLVFSGFFIYCAIYLYVVRMKIAINLKEYLKQTYPEYELAE